MDALRKAILDENTKPGDLIKAIHLLEKLEAGIVKSTKPRGRPFKKKVPAVVVPTTPAQWEAEEDARVIPSDFQQRAEQFRLMAESRKEPDSDEDDLVMGSPQTVDPQASGTPAPQKLVVEVVSTRPPVDAREIMRLRNQKRFLDKPRPW